MLAFQTRNASKLETNYKHSGKQKKAIPRQEGWLAVVERMRLELITSTLPVSRSSQMS